MLLNELEREQSLKDQGYRFKSRAVFFLLPCLLFVMALGFYHHYKPLPSGLDFASAEYIVNESDLKLLVGAPSLTSTSSALIIDQIYQHIAEANQYILLDQTVFNDYSPANKNFSSELTKRLVAKKASSPDLKIDFITDPFNTLYGGSNNAYLESLRAAGINVIVTDLASLPDSNPYYSAWWRAFVAWLGNSPRYAWFANPWDESGLSRSTLRSRLAYLNFKANERKVFVADHLGQLVSIISAGDLAVSVRGPLAESVYQSESALARLSHNSLYSLPLNLLNQAPAATNRYAKVKLLTEQRVKLAVLEGINKLESGDELKIASNYLSDQTIISALLASADNGVLIQVLLDPTKTSRVNLASAEELSLASHRSIKLKWANAATAQIIIARSKADKQMTVITGSSSLTRRDLDNYNLQSNLALVLNTDWNLAADFDHYFANAWQAGTEYNTNESLAWYLPYLLGFLEWTGMGNF